MKLSVVIPALNEELAIGDVLKEVPIASLARMGYEVEVIVVDNGSQDDTIRIASFHGATVVVQPMRGYGNAYKAGFAYSTGDVVATGDADLTYPFSDLPKILRQMERRRIEFVNTDRLSTLRPGTMTRSHVFGNWLLTVATRLLFGWPFKDSQSGMWVFKRYVWDGLDVRASGMPFSQELKIEAYVRGFRCDEVAIDYRARAGKEKLRTVSDGLGNIMHLLKKRITLGVAPRALPAPPSTVADDGRSTPHLAPSLVAGTGDPLWEERWYDRDTGVDHAVLERGPRIPLPALAGLDSPTPSEHRQPMVVWRARPATSHVSVESSDRLREGAI